MMANDAKPRRRWLSHVLPIVLVLAVAALAVGLARSKAVRARYHAWRIENEMGAVQKRSINALVGLGERAVPALRDALASERKATREAAAEALSRIDAPAARAALARVLDSSHSELRVFAISALMGTDDPELLPVFRAALHDRNGDVSHLALYALLNYPPDVAIGELIDALRLIDTGQWAEAAVRLGDYPMSAVMPRLFEALRADPTIAPGVRRLIEFVSRDDPGPDAEDLLAWWEANREAVMQPEPEELPTNEEQ